jgi:hypothetical protein
MSLKSNFSGVHSQLYRREVKLFAMCNNFGVRDVCLAAIRGSL